MSLTLYDTLHREKRVFQPRDPERVTLYVCGPTVYDYAHIGNARPPVVFHVLTRLLRRAYRPFVHQYVALSGDLASYLEHKVGVPRRRIAQIHNGVDDLRFHPSPGARALVAGGPGVFAACWAFPFPFRGALPYIGDGFFKHNALGYVAFALFPVAAFVLNRTTLGLKIRAAGMKPEAADSLGVSVAGVIFLLVGN